MVVSQGWDIQQVDINNAFLNGDMQEVVFIEQLEGFTDATRPSHDCLLKKKLFGLKQTFCL